MKFIKTYKFQILKSMLILFCIVLSQITVIDTIAEEYTEKGIKRALLTYGVSRSLNAVISVAQGTEVALSPVGVGVTFTPGQILDPVNDLVERFSWVILASGTSLGIQRVFLEMSSAPIINWLVTSLGGVLIFIIWFYKPVDGAQGKAWSNGISRLFAIFIILRFSVPVFALINEIIYLEFLQDRYQTAQLELERAGSKIDAVNIQPEINTQHTDSIIEKAGNWLTSKTQDIDIERQIASVKESANIISQQVIDIIVVFILQTIVFPLVFLWLLMNLFKYSLYRH